MTNMKSCIYMIILIACFIAGSILAGAGEDVEEDSCKNVRIFLRGSGITITVVAILWCCALNQADDDSDDDIDAGMGGALCLTCLVIFILACIVGTLVFDSKCYEDDQAKNLAIAIWIIVMICVPLMVCLVCIGAMAAANEEKQTTTTIAPSYATSSQSTAIQISNAQPQAMTDTNVEISESDLIDILQQVVLRVGCFEIANQTNKHRFLQKLRAISPSSSTAFYDATIGGITHMLMLYKTLIDFGGGSKHKFIQIILTDGEDTGSQHSFAETRSCMHSLASLGDICQTIFIGVNINDNVRIELTALSRVAGDNSQFYEVNDEGIDDLFSRIQINIGLQTRMQALGISDGENAAIAIKIEREPQLYLQLNHYVVLFNLDISGSMHGQRWLSVRSSVERIMNSLNALDMFGCCVFNNTADIITGQSS